MECFLTAQKTRTGSPRCSQTTAAADHTKKMATATRGDESCSSDKPAQAQSTGRELEYEKIEAAVAKLLQPPIVTAVEHSLKQGLAALREDIASHT